MTHRRDIFLLLLSNHASARHSYYEPLKCPEDDHLAEASQWLLFVVLFTALLIRVDVAQDNPTDQARLGVLLVVLSLMPLAYMILVTVLEFRELGVDVSAEGENKDAKDIVSSDEEQAGDAVEVEVGRVAGAGGEKAHGLAEPDVYDHADNQLRHDFGGGRVYAVAESDGNGWCCSLPDTADIYEV